MNACCGLLYQFKLTVCSIVLLIGTTLPASLVQSETCRLAANHVGLTFPVEKVAPDWACRLQLTIDNYTTANKVGPLRTPLPESLYAALLDRPPLAAALVNRLGYAPYQAVRRGPDQFFGNDGEGLEGLIELVYRDRTTRIYSLDGVYVGTWLPRIAGKAVVFIRMNPVKESDGSEAVDTTLVSYTRLNSRVLSGLVSLMRPLIGSGVIRRLTRAVDAANRLSQDMRRFPERVWDKAVAAPARPPDDLALLKQTLAELDEPSNAKMKSATTP
jgi:hypothetical protein